MNADDLDERFVFAIDLIKEAGHRAHAYFRDVAALTIKTKGLQDFASEADVQVELTIRRRIAETFPDDGFFGEETGHAGIDGKTVVWVVDPIDGTQPFLSGLSSWCVSIALVSGASIQMGVVYAPARDELFAGSRRHPATLNGQRIAVRRGRLTDGLVATGHCTRVSPEDFVAPFLGLLKAGGMFFRDGSGALSLCYVACGRLIGFMEQHINAWDCLGGIAIVHAAGGASNDFLADDGMLKGGRLIAASPALLPDLAAAIGWEAPDLNAKKVTL